MMADRVARGRLFRLARTEGLRTYGPVLSRRRLQT
jgi:hypothetical protein